MKKMMKYKYPIEYQISPIEIDHGIHWLTLKLKNVGSKTITDLDVQLYSTDTYHMAVNGTGHHLDELKPNGERNLVFRVNAHASVDVHAVINAWKDDKYFWWDSGWMYVRVGTEKAELERLLVLSHPYTPIGKTVEAEATIKGLLKSSDLKLEFWLDTPSGKWEEMANIKAKNLSAGEEAQYSAEFTPNETGYYTVNAYLYDGWKIIGTKTQTIYAQKN